ncbi:MAG: hypothetical protein GX787_11020 [Tissierellia bacterium]|nr:hypothetical protein [Tissierellia bacterium]
MRGKEFNKTLFVVLLGMISIYLFAVLDIQLKESAQKIEMEKYNIYRILEALILIFFGVLVEYKKVLLIFKNGFSINKYYLITAISLAILLILPYDTIMRLGIGHPGSIKGIISLSLTSINIRSVLSVLTGILIIRSLASSKSNKQIFRGEVD